MLDIAMFRKESGGDPELVRESQRRRFASVEVVDEVIRLDDEWRKAQFKTDQFKKEINSASKEVGKAKKAKEDASELMEKVKQIKQDMADTQTLADNLKEQVNKKLMTIGNIVHSSVPISETEDDNETVKEWGDKPALEEYWHHHELLHLIDGFDPERGAKVAGHRGYFLKGNGMLLSMALAQYAISFLGGRDYLPISVPLFMNKGPMSKCAQLEQFDEELYTVTTASQNAEGGNMDNAKYLIATSEQPMCAYHEGALIDPKDLPNRFAAFSTCFRKEAGSHGRDVWGIFRVHQFEKVEQFCVTVPEDSWEEHNKMITHAQDFMETLNIPYRVVNIVSKELNNAASKKFDLEGWFPGYGTYRELVSCSNCTDYQSRRLNTSLEKKKGEKKKYVHMLNSTLMANTRVLCAILELNQTDDGIVVPEVLRPFLGGKEFFPFLNKPKKGWKKEKAPAQ